MNLLFVDDEKSLHTILKVNFNNRKDNNKLFCATNVDDAINILNQKKIDIIVTDLNMPEKDGFELVNYRNKNFPDKDIYIVSGSLNESYLKISKQMGVKEFISKPIDFDTLLDKVLA